MRISKLSMPPSDAKSKDHGASSIPFLSSFKTPLGWIGILGQSEKLTAVFAGYRSAEAVRSKARAARLAVDEADWNPELRELFIAYAEGETIDFSGVEIALPKLTHFRNQVLKATRLLGYGQTVSYGELAAKAGHPGAARAVGTVMSTNRFPILIPCHRVLAAGGKLGGYTSPAGTKFKIQLLELEAQSVRRDLDATRYK